MEYTTIRITKDVKKNLDKITTRGETYSERLNKLFVEAQTNIAVNTIIDSIENSSEWITLDDLEKKMEKENLI